MSVQTKFSGSTIVGNESARTEWLDIATAPKDGTEILLYCLPNEVPSLRPQIANGYWKATTGFMAPGLFLFTHSVGPSFKPKYWQPLEAPLSIDLSASEKNALSTSSLNLPLAKGTGR